MKKSNKGSVFLIFVLSTALCLSTLFAFLSYNSKMNYLNKTIEALEEEMKPLKSFYAKRRSLVEKEKYDELNSNYEACLEEKTLVSTRLSEKQRMVLTLMHSIEEVRQTNVDLTEKNEVLKRENTELKSKLELKKLDLNNRPTENEEKEK